MEKNNSSKTGWKTVTNRKKSSKTRELRFRWKPSKDLALTAGGLLPYDDEGIWVIGEYNKHEPTKLEYTDPGGRYSFEDGDIFATIAREFNEEMYYSVEISRKQVFAISTTSESVYIDGYKNKPVYVCILAPLSHLEWVGIHFDPKEFINRRKLILQQNPDVPKGYYRPVKLLYITYSEIVKGTYKMSNRLKCILEKSEVLSAYLGSQ